MTKLVTGASVLALCLTVASCKKSQEDGNKAAAKTTEEPANKAPVKPAPPKLGGDMARNAAKHMAHVHGGTTYSMYAFLKVKDYATWKTALDAQLPAFKAAGVRWHALAHKNGNKNRVVLHAVGSDLAKLKALTMNEDVKKAMQKAGLVSRPDFMFAKDVDLKSPKGKADAKAAVLAMAGVKDFATWKKAFDAGSAMRDKAGIVAHVVSQLDGKDNTVMMFAVAKDAKALEGYFTDPEVAKAMTAAGVIGKPRLEYATMLETKRY